MSDLSEQIRRVLSSDSPAQNRQDTLNAVNAFVKQQQNLREQSVLDQLRNDLEAIYKELVDHTSSANFETFITILCAFLPVFRPINVITHWWDLALRAALRDPRLSTKTLRQVKELTLSGLILESPKVTEFRRRIVELYLDAYDESSGLDALEHAAMSPHERNIQQLWKRNLGDILTAFCMKRPDEFLTTINVFFKYPQWRLRLSLLLGVITRSSEFPIKNFAIHAILDSLLLSLVVDESSTVFEIEIAALVTLLPQFAVHTPDTLKRILPSCYAILARVVCWKPRSASPLVDDDGRSDSSSPTHPSDPEMDVAQTFQLRSDLEWQKLEATLTSTSQHPSPLPLFRCLYGLYPSNTLEFLRDPVVHISRTDFKSPFAEDWPDILDEDQIRTRSRALLRENILNFALLKHTVESELAAPDRWSEWDVSRVIMMCTMLDVRNAALSLSQMPELGRNPSVPGDTHTTQSEVPSDTGDSEGSQPKELRCTDLSFPGRPRVSVQDILATYNALKSGADIDIIDPTPEWPQLVFPTVVPSPANDSGASIPKPAGGNTSYETIPPHVEEVISSLQRENLLLRNELNYELWLKRENVRRIGRLYHDRILVKGAEVERQGLHNKLREYKGQIQRLRDALLKEQAGAAATKSQHTDYTNRLQARLKTEREEKRSWADEKSSLKKASDDAQAMLDAQATRLADATTRVLELETQIKEYSPKIQRLKDYEEKIEQFTKSQQLWDDDIRRYKTQELYLDELRSRYRQKLQLIESYEKANLELEATISTTTKRIASLESQPPPPPRRISDSSQVAYRMMEDLRKQLETLTLERDALLEKTYEQGDQIEDLKMTLESMREF